MTFFPDEASSVSGGVDQLFLLLVAISIFFCVAVAGPLLFFAVKYRRGSPADRSGARDGSIRLEMTWIVIPFFIALGLFGWGAVLYAEMQQPPEDALEIHVVAKQWMWKVQHDNGRREINELHVPVGRPVMLTMASQDVIHSFYVPAFRTKQDVVPGKYTRCWFQPTRTGTFHLFCAEYCGTDHSRMIGRVVVMEPETYAAWLERGQPSASMADAGLQLFRSLGCSGCHGTSAVVRAPDLAGVYGRSVPLTDGTVVQADQAYLRDSILRPASQVVAGYENLMPTYDGQLDEAQVMQLIAYLRSLGPTDSLSAEPLPATRNP